MSSGVSCNLCDTQVADGSALVWVKDGFEIVRCPCCGLLFRRKLPAPETLRAIYAESYFRRPEGDVGGQGYDDYIGDEELHRRNGAVRVRRLARHTPPGRLLDVGAAAGFFMDEARRAGWRVEGVDVSPEMSAYGREQLGLDLQTAPFRDVARQPQSFDCVTMWDYIEHSFDPAGELAHAHELLRPGGFLALSTGDADSLVARLSGRRWHLLTPRHHNFFFTGATLGRACHQAGFDIVWTGHPGAQYTLRYLTYKLRSMAPASTLVRRVGETFEHSRAGTIAVPVNLWDIVTLIARRRR